jgi:hypothetical protein
MITITEEQYDKLRGILRYADWWLDDYPKHMYPEQYESDKEEITQAQEVIQDIDASLLLTTPKFEPAQEEA